MGIGNSKGNGERALIEELRGQDSTIVDRGDNVLKELTASSENAKIALLLLAMKRNDANEIFNILNSGKIQINEQIGKNKITPLHLAILVESVQTTRALLTYPNLDMNIGDSDGDTPLLFAIRACKSDIKALTLAAILVGDVRCQITKENDDDILPIVASAAKGFKETTKLLIRGNRMKIHAPHQILRAIQAAMSKGHEDIADIILADMSVSMRDAIVGVISGDRNVAHYGRFLARGEISAKIPESESDEETLRDSSGKTIRLGDMVCLKDEDTLRRFHSSPNKVLFKAVANKRGIIHDVSSGLFLDVLETPHVGRFSSNAVNFVQSRKIQAIADGTQVWIGAYVKVAAEVDVVQELNKGHGGWVEDMKLSCGKTGRVLDIDKDDDIFVSFAFGKSYCFNPMALLGGCNEDVEGRDAQGNIFSKGTPLRVINDVKKFKELQLENSLSVDAEELEVVGKLVTTSRVRIRYRHISVLVKSANQIVSIAPSTISCLCEAKDHNNIAFGVGDEVKVISSIEEFKNLQTKEFGGWIEKFASLVGVVGVVVGLDVNGKFEATDMVINVKFDCGKYYLNPKALFRVVPKMAVDVQKLFIREDEMTIIPRNQLEVFEEVGEGAFGCVVKGAWNGSPCAIKQIKSIVIKTMKREDIIKEAKIQYSLKHPNIVQLFGMSVENDLWMVMRFIDGSDLYAKTFPEESGQKRLSFGSKLKVARQACNAIAYLHDKGFLHSDIKPQNMIVENQSDCVYLCDFGISRYLGSVGIAEFSTMHTNTFGGTMYYLAPECLQDDPVTGKHTRPTFKADIWALGVVFAELFTEKKLFSNMTKLMECMIGSYNGIDNFLNGMDSPVRPILKSILVKSKDDRPTAQQMQTFFLGIEDGK